MNACRYRTLAQVKGANAVVIEALVTKLERGLASRHLGEMGNERGDVPVLRNNQLGRGVNKLIARQLFEFLEVAMP